METTLIFNSDKDYQIANKFLRKYSKENGLSIDNWMGAGATYQNKSVSVYTYRDRCGAVFSGDSEIILQLKKDLIKSLEGKAIK